MRVDDTNGEGEGMVGIKRNVVPFTSHILKFLVLNH